LKGHWFGYSRKVFCGLQGSGMGNQEYLAKNKPNAMLGCRKSLTSLKHPQEQLRPYTDFTFLSTVSAGPSGRAV